MQHRTVSINLEADQLGESGGLVDLKHLRAQFTAYLGITALDLSNHEHGVTKQLLTLALVSIPRHNKLRTGRSALTANLKMQDNTTKPIVVYTAKGEKGGLNYQLPTDVLTPMMLNALMFDAIVGHWKAGKVVPVASALGLDRASMVSEGFINEEKPGMRSADVMTVVTGSHLWPSVAGKELIYTWALCATAVTTKSLDDVIAASIFTKTASRFARYGHKEADDKVEKLIYFWFKTHQSAAAASVSSLNTLRYKLKQEISWDDVKVMLKNPTEKALRALEARALQDQNA